MRLHDRVCPRRAVTCEAYPVCEEGWVEVEECPEGVECTQESVCGYTITCAKDDPVQCQAYPPSCPEGSEQVPAVQPRGHPRCFEESLCGYTITCEVAPQAACLGIPTCPQGSAEVDSCDPSTATCPSLALRARSCAASSSTVSACPQGYVQTTARPTLHELPGRLDPEVNQCGQGEDCFTETLCGYSILCQKD